MSLLFSYNSAKRPPRGGLSEIQSGVLIRRRQTRARAVCPLSAVVSTDRRNTLSLTAKMECLVINQRFRRGFTAAEKTELWDRWQRGESLKAIGRTFGKPSSSIYCQLAPHGGIRPAPRRRSRLALTLAEREEISRGIVAHQSARLMAKLGGRSPSTVSRELSRNGGYDRYRAALADETAWVRARRPKRCKLANNTLLQRAVASKLRLNWAPEQIAGWLKRAHPDDEFYHVSHETIYRSLFVQARGRGGDERGSCAGAGDPAD